jgi:hypothetical protein
MIRAEAIRRSGERHVRRVARARIQLSGRDDLLRLARARPGQRGDRAAAVFVELELEVVLLAGDEREPAAVFGGPVVRPIVDELLPVDPQAHAVVAGREEGIRLAEQRLDLTGPTHRKVVDTDARPRCAARPIEVDGRVRARERRRRRERLIVEISA